MSETPPRFQRNARGLVTALAAVLLLIVAVYGLTFLDRGAHPNPAPTVDYLSQVAEVQRAAPYTVVVPRPEPTGWRATSVDWGHPGNSLWWHVGFLTPKNEYVALEESDQNSAQFVARKVPGGHATGRVMVDGHQWRELAGSDGTTALVRREPPATIVVVGSARLPQLELFAASLR
ncbi:MAG: DUF4245 domain-containing protein [Sciscionella sp.]